MPKPCENEDCAGAGTFFGDTCPGSEDASEEMHHCADCGELWCEDKSIICCLCGDYWCPDYQEVCVFINCEHVGARLGNDEYACPTCFLGKKSLWCTKKECKCGQKAEKVRRKWDNYNKKGRSTGKVAMESTSSFPLWTMEVFEFDRRTKLRLEWHSEVLPLQTKIFTGRNVMRTFAIKLLKEKVKEGFRLSDVEGVFERMKLEKRLALE